VRRALQVVAVAGCGGGTVEFAVGDSCIRRSRAVRQVRLTDEQITYLITVLRNNDRPVTTDELVAALRKR
jgi:hypothetical protein